MQVDFHTGVAQPMHFACRLLRKAYRQGARVAVVAPIETLRLLDRELWTFDERDFVPHVRLTQEPMPTAQLQRTPLWLLEPQTLGLGLSAGAPEVLVNLGAELATEHLQTHTTRLIEIVARDADEADRARLRWRHYRSQGWNVVHHQAEAAA